MAVALLSPKEANASHYRYGNISWSRVNDGSRTVTFKVTQAWRRSAFSGVMVGASITSGTTFNFGDGGTTGITLIVTSENIPEDWFAGVATIVHTYGGALTSFNANYASNARISTLQNNADGNFRCETIVQLVSGNTGSPVTTLPAIVNLAIGQAPAHFNVPASDPDGQTIKYFLTTFAQTQATNPAGFSIDSTTGQASFNTVGKTVGHLWTGAFQIIDAVGTVTIVDFIMKMVGVNTPPVFDYSVTPLNNTTFSINPGQLLTFDVKALCTDVGSTVTLTAVGQPIGVSFSPALPVTANPVTTTFSFTPTGAQLGIYVITFIAERDGGVQTNTTVTINVNTNPVFIDPTKAQGVSYLIPTASLHKDTVVATNPDTTVTTQIFSASIPAGASLSPATPTSPDRFPMTEMSWHPAPSDFGPHTLSFMAKDENGKTATRSYILVPNTPPLFTSTPVLTGHVNDLYTYNIVLADSNLGYGDTVEINTMSLPAWLTLTDNGDGTAKLSGTPGPGDGGDFLIILAGEDIWHHSHDDVDQSFTISVITCLPPTVSCRNVTIYIDPAGNPVSVNALVGATSELSSQTKGSDQFCPGAPVSTGACDCPPGYVATGYEGEVVNGYGNVLSKFRIKCSALNPDGTMGAGTTATCYNGSGSGSNSFDVDATSGEAIVGFSNRMGCGLDQLGGLSKPIADIIAATSNATNNAMTVAGGNGGGATPTQVVPDGYVVTGMQTYIDNTNEPGLTAGYAWRYSLLSDVMKGIGSASGGCGNLTATLSQSSFNCSDAGVNTITLTVKDQNGDSSVCEATVTVIDSILPTIGSNSPLCTGATLNLTSSSPRNGATYLWTGPNGFSTNDQNPSMPVTTASAGTYTVTVTSDFGCEKSLSTEVTVDSLICSASSNTPVCNGKTIMLFSNSSGSAGPTYAWEGPNGFTSNDQNPTIPNATPANSGVYTVTVTSAIGCTCNSSTAVIVGAIIEVNSNITVNLNTTPPTITGNQALTSFASFSKVGATANLWYASFNLGINSLLIKTGATITTTMVGSGNNLYAPGLRFTSDCSMQMDCGAHVVVSSLNKNAGDITMSAHGDVTINGEIRNEVTGTNGMPGAILVSTKCGDLNVGQCGQIYDLGIDGGGNLISLLACGLECNQYNTGNITVSGLVKAYAHAHADNLDATRPRIKVVALAGAVTVNANTAEPLYDEFQVGGGLYDIYGGLLSWVRDNNKPGMVWVQAQKDITVKGHGTDPTGAVRTSFGAIAAKATSSDAPGGLVDIRSIGGNIKGYDRAFDVSGRNRLALGNFANIKLLADLSITLGHFIATNSNPVVDASSPGVGDKGGRNDLRAYQGGITVGGGVLVSASVPAGSGTVQGTNFFTSCTGSVGTGTVTPTPTIAVNCIGDPTPLYTTCTDLTGAALPKTASSVVDPLLSNDMQGIIIYPNPANGNCKIVFANEYETSVKLILYNYLGQEMWSAMHTSTDSKTISLDLNGYASGVYFVSFVKDGKTIDTRKLVINSGK